MGNLICGPTTTIVGVPPTPATLPSTGAGDAGWYMLAGVVALLAGRVAQVISRGNW
jgi:LPXTG-motif cell wall-anchored protein